MDLTDSTALVTGGAGLVGSHLAAQLLDRGATVRVADDLSKGDRDRVPDGAEFVGPTSPTPTTSPRRSPMTSISSSTSPRTPTRTTTTTGSCSRRTRR